MGWIGFFEPTTPPAISIADVNVVEGDSGAKTERVGNTTVTFVKAAGTFSSGMPGGPTTPLKDYALRGAILESPTGDVYVKMTGPQKVVKHAEPAFEEMIRGAASH